MRYPTLRQTLEKFVSDEACHKHLGRIRWPTGPRCPKCKGADVIRFQAQGNQKAFLRELIEVIGVQESEVGGNGGI
jgi:hypothetical protein